MPATKISTPIRKPWPRLLDLPAILVYVAFVCVVSAGGGRREWFVVDDSERRFV